MMNKSAVNALAIFLLTCPGILHSQISNATPVGTVTDPSGAVVVGAKVEAKNIGTGIARSTNTDASGEDTIPNPPAAHYSVTVTAPGFKAFNATEVELQVAQRAMLNAALQVGTAEQELTITASAPMIDTATSSVGQVVNPTAVDHMPLNGRSFWQLANLTPGATYTPGGQGTRTGGSSIRSSVVNVTINGFAPHGTGSALDRHFPPRVPPADT